MSDNRELTGIRIAIGTILAIAALLGFIFSLVAIGPNGPHGGVSPLILLPYGVLIIALTAYFILRDVI